MTNTTPECPECGGRSYLRVEVETVTSETEIGPDGSTGEVRETDRSLDAAHFECRGCYRVADEELAAALDGLTAVGQLP